MPQVRSKLLTGVLLFTWACLSAAGDPPRNAGELATRFVEAWNAHDPAAFGALMAEDADWVTASGVRLRGRERIQAYLSEEHASWAKRTNMRAINIRVRPMNEKTSIVLFEWEIASPGEGAGVSTVSRGNNLFVAVHDTHWTIVAGQVARGRAP